MTRSAIRPRAAAPGVRLFLLSFLILFVELLLIRWTAGYIIYLSYFTNFVLLGSFLGIGLGFLKPYQRLFRFAPLLLGGVLCLVYVFPTKISHSGSGKLLYFGAHTGGIPIWVALPIVFVTVALTLMVIAEEAARSFGALRPLGAYRLDLIGSICGSAVFALASLLEAPPLAWGGIAGLVFLVLYGRRLRALQVVGLVLVLLPLTLELFASGEKWSPYYKVDVTKHGVHQYGVSVNGVPHQSITSTQRHVATDRRYTVPYLRLRHRPPRNVLIIGAGNGVDASVALRQGARHVDAVEIDPQLLSLGRRLNPDRPYSSPRVSTHVTDGRQFLERTHKRYDLILFALPDSLTLVANQSSLRLESYLFTLQAFKAVRAHLTPGGVFGMYNSYRRQWLVSRLAESLKQVFGHPPCVDEGMAAGPIVGPRANLTIGRTSDAVKCAHPWSAPPGVPAPATDDHPFAYLKTRSVPGFYLLALALVLIFSLGAVGAVSGSASAMRRYSDLFFMGAAFLLLETKSVVQFALLFGTTWFVNSLVFIGVLLAVLGAVELTARIEIARPRRLYALLLVALLVAWALPPGLLLGAGFWPRLLAAFAIYFAPIFLANVIFARRFREVAASTTAFGANLLGAMVGGVLEYGSLIVGYRDLLLVVAVLYGFALATGWRVLGRRQPSLASAPA